MESEYFRAVVKSEIALGKMKKVTLYGKEIRIVIVNVNGNYAVGSECTHFGMRPFRGSFIEQHSYVPKS